jgi:hypothetical protein
MVRNELFGTPVGSSLRALNPGLARGVLRIPGWRERRGEFDRAGIYLLPETIAELPPIAGILTQGEGSSLSHVQLLARNLAIPNVVVGSEIIQRIRSRVGDTIVLAVSPGGVVQVAADGPRWDAVFGREGKPSLRLRPDLEKLDLDSAEIVPLSELTADDSGRIVGPKSANLGELKQAFGAAVPDGVVIPFGVFRRLLEQPMNPGGPSVFRWMAGQYSSLRALRGDHEAQEKATREFLTRLRAWIESSDPGPEFRAELESALREHFGPDGTYGVFVRSDTNVEDLPNFTGAGLNLTVPNVVGEQAIYDAIRRVWASPFTERAFSWRQAHMDRPLYVFPAVLVQRAFPSEKSGVMVTKDVQGGRPGWLTVAVNEGVGGVVDGQAAESLLVREDGSEATLLSSASARTQRVLAPTGGIEEIPTSGRGRILEPREAARLAQVARLAPERFDTLRDEDGEAIPADIEFAFAGGRMAILQIRPFVESKSAQENEYLMSLDARTKGDEEEDDDEGRVRLDSSAAGGRRW